MGRCGYWPALSDAIACGTGSGAGVGGATGTAAVSLKMSLKELARPGAWENNDANKLFMEGFQDDRLQEGGPGAERSAQLKLQLDMSR
jgi:hypothetical protein